MKDLSVVNNSTEIANVENYKEIAIQWLTSTGNLKKFTESEKSQFCDICVAFGLNPIKKEVYGIKYGDNFNIIVGYETYLKRAQRTNLLDGFNTTVEKVGDDLKAICTIYRKDWTHPFVHEVFLSEYTTGKSLWASKPITMIKKVAEAQAFRKCFTDELGGMPYTKEELSDIESESSPVISETSPNVKEITSKSSVTSPKTKTKNPKTEEIKALMMSEYSDGGPVFNETEKEEYRALIRSGKIDDAIAKAKDALNQKLAAYNQAKAVEDAFDDVDFTVSEN